MGFFNVFLVWGTAGILILVAAFALLWSASLPKIRAKKLTFIMVSLGLNVFIIPLSLFIGIMATDAPDSTTKDFFAGFFFIQALPLLIIVLAVLKWMIFDKKALTN